MHKVLLTVPSSGEICEESAEASWNPSMRHEITRMSSCLSNGNFNTLWAEGLNRGMSGEHTHMAMIHADLCVLEQEPGLRWLDILIEEMEKKDADFISVPMAIKDHRGLVSCGLGDPDDRWMPYRRFCTNELGKMPLTFTAADLGYPDKYLLHNHALCVWDLRKPLWYWPDSSNRCQAAFVFQEEIRLVDGKWKPFQASEDWVYSRQLWEMGVKTCVTRRVKVLHYGRLGFANWGNRGEWKNGDEETAAKWRKPQEEKSWSTCSLPKAACT